MAVQLKTLNGYEFNAAALGGNPASYFLPATGKAADSALLGGKAPGEFMSADAARIQMVCLWENASPSSDFASSTVSVNGAGYDYYLVTFRAHKSTANEIVPPVFFPVTRGASAIALIGSTGTVDGAIKATKRRILSSTAETVEFEHAHTSTSGGNFVDQSDTLIPVSIYGVKGME